MQALGNPYKWRNQLRMELRSNKSGFLPSKRPSLAAYLPDSFPSIPILLLYVSPLTSKMEQPLRPPSPVLWSSNPDPARIASLCELYFEWGIRDNIMKRFRTMLWQGIVCRALRCRVIDAGVVPGCDPCDQDDTALPQMHPSTSEGNDVPSSLSTPFSLALFHLVPPTSMPSSDPALLMDVLSIREHSSTDALVTHAASGVRGIRPLLDILTASDEDDEEVDEDKAAADDNNGSRRLKTAARSRAKKQIKRTQSAPVSPTASLRLWLPAVMVRAVVPDLVDAYEMKKRGRART
ncbi:hypothetical protein EDC04DRAFT_2774840 [Pisolithus marmoratus]|nr:hypothetical protein EDC04DRAFT_2774840 [Pisolithus marmoratus]